MYFEEIEPNQTRLWIVNSLLELLKKKNYSAITINMLVEHAGLGRRTFYRYFKTKDEAMCHIAGLLMDQFACNIKNNHSSGLEGVAVSYFQFWEQYIDILLLLKKAHVLHFIEDNLLELVVDVAKKANHIPQDMPAEQLTQFYEKYRYEFAFKLAGFWKTTILWCEEIPRKSPEEMAKIIASFMLP